MNLARFASLDDLSIDDLRAAVAHLEELEGHPSWVYVRGLLRGQQAAQTGLLTVPPSSRTTTDGYALRNAHLAGWVEALQYCADLPRAVREIAERVIAREQAAAEMAARQHERQVL